MMRRLLANYAYRSIRTYYRSPIITFNPIFKSPSTQSNFIFFSFVKQDDSSSNSTQISPTEFSTDQIDFEDVSNEDFRKLINKHFMDNDEEVIQVIMEAILRRKLTGKHEETDDELMDQLEMMPIDGGGGSKR
ncbi:hypothetical protein ACHQM5_003065 [Ranunculus cassubicifolius]